MLSNSVYGPLVTRLALRDFNSIGLDEVQEALKKICGPASGLSYIRRCFARNGNGAEAWFVECPGQSRDGSKYVIEFGPTPEQPAIALYEGAWAELWLIVRQPEQEEGLSHGYSDPYESFMGKDDVTEISKYVNLLSRLLREALPEMARDVDEARAERAAHEAAEGRIED